MSYTSLKHKQVKTKKPHLCFSCLKRFPENTVMVNWAGITDGDFNSGYTCLTCEEIIEIYAKNSQLYEGKVEFGFVNEMTSKEITPEIVLETLKIKENE
jgi:hypothetical protein